MNNSSHVKKKINLKAVLILMGVLILLGGAVHFVHAFQVKRNAEGLKAQAALIESEGKLKEAAGIWTQYVGMKPDDTDAQARYGILLEQMADKAKNPWAARVKPFQIFETVLVRDSSRQDIRRRQAKLALQLGNTSAAKAHLAILLAEFPEDADLLQLKAYCAKVEGKFDEAGDAYSKAISHNSKRVDLFYEYARLLRDKLNNQIETADQRIEDMVNFNERSPEARLKAGEYFNRYKEWDKAEKHLIFAMDELKVTDPEVFLQAAAAAAQLKKKEALEYLKRGRVLNPGDGRFVQAEISIDFNSGDRDKALKVIEKALSPKGQNDDAPKIATQQDLFSWAEILLVMDQPKKAREMIARYKEKGAKAPVAFLEGKLAMVEKSWGQAREHLEKVILWRRDSDPEVARRTNLWLAQCYEALGNRDLQLAACRRALEKEPEWLPGRQALAACLAAMPGKSEDAIQIYRTLADENVPGARIELARLLLLRNLHLPAPEQDWAAVEQPLKDFPADKPGQVAVQLLRADILVAQRKYDQARKLVEAERDRDPKQFAPWMFLINLSQAQGATSVSLLLLDQAERNTGKHAEWTMSRIRLHFRQNEPVEAIKKQLAKVEQDLLQYPEGDRAKLLFGLGDSFLVAGDLPNAKRLWGLFAERLPSDIHVRFRLMDAALEAGQEKEAQDWLAEVKRIEGAGGAMGTYGEAALQWLHARKGDKSAFGKARAILAEVAALRPSWARVPLLEARLLEAENQKDKALEKYQAALDRGERRLGVVQSMVWLLYERGRYAEASELLRKIPDEALLSSGLKRLAAEVNILGNTSGDLAEIRSSALDLARKAVEQKEADYQDYIWLGLLAGAADQPQEAEKALRKARELKPDIADTWAPLVVLLARTDSLKAEAELVKARDNLPPDQVPLVLAVGYEALGKHKEAEENYRAALAKRPTDLTLLRNASTFYRRIGESAKAEAVLRKILEPSTQAPEIAIAWARRTLALTLATGGGFGKFQQALTLLETNLKQFGETEEDRRTRALVLATQPSYRSEAIKLFEKLTNQRNNTAPDVLFLLAQLHEADGNWNMAKPELVTLVRDQQNNSIYLARLVTLMLRHKDVDEALPYVIRLARLKPNQLETVALHARVLKEKGLEREALNLVHTFADSPNAPMDQVGYLFEDLGQKLDAEVYFRKFAGEPTAPERKLTLAAFLGRGGDPGKTKEALDLCDKAWQKCAPEAVALTCVAVVRNGKTTEADERQVIKSLSDATTRYPTKRIFAQCLADLHDYLGHSDLALRLYRELLETDPRNVTALNNVAVLLALQEGQGPEALQRINTAISIAGPDPQLLDTRAMVHLSNQHPDLALIDLEKAIHQAPSPLFYFHKARAYQMSRDNVNAQTWLTKATAEGLTATALPYRERPMFERLNKELNGG